MNLIEDLVIQEIQESELPVFGVIVPAGKGVLEKAASIWGITERLKTQGATVFCSFPEVIFGSTDLLEDAKQLSKEGAINRLQNPVYPLEESEALGKEAAELYEITPHDRELLKSNLKGASEKDIEFLKEAGLVEATDGGNHRLTEFASTWLGLKRVHQ